MFLFFNFIQKENINFSQNFTICFKKIKPKNLKENFFYNKYFCPKKFFYFYFRFILKNQTAF